jgi:tetratricopeptide (TPR) repeat protein
MGRLAIFSGGCTLEGAERVCDASLDTLQALVEKNLLVHADGRFSQLDTIREFARNEVLAHGEHDQLAHRHASYFADVVDEVLDDDDMDARRLNLLRLSVHELDNLRAALEWTLERCETELALRLAYGIGWTLFRIDVGEGRRRLARVLALDGGSPLRRALALESAATFAREAGARDDAMELGRAGLALARQAGDDALVIRLLLGLGRQSTHAREDGARKLLEDALLLARRNGIDVLVSEALHALAELDHDQGRHAASRARFEESLAILRQLGFSHRQTPILHGLGDLDLEEGRPDAAFARYREALERTLPLDAEVGALREAAFNLAGLAAVFASQTDRQRAGVLWGAAEATLARRGTWLNDAERRLYEPLLESLESDAFRAAVEAGRSMSPRDAVAYALAQVSPAVAAAPEQTA